MKALWSIPGPPNEMLAVDDTLITADAGTIVAFDHDGKERWSREFPSVVRDLTRCGHGVAFTQKAHRNAAEAVQAVDLAGKDLWRYERAWGLLFNGITGDDHGVVLYGQDDGPGVRNRWVGIDAVSGAVTFDVSPATNVGATLAGEWMIASLGDGDGSDGVVRTTRNGAEPTTLTKLAHLAFATNGVVVLLRAADETVAIELATGRERWRAPGGDNFEIAIDNGRAAWVDAPRHSAEPVVYDLASGSALWRGAPVPPPPRTRGEGYRCKLADHALVCYSGFAAVTFFALSSADPLRSGPRADEGLFLGARFIEPSADLISCWEVP